MKTDYNKLFWKIGIAVFILIGFNHAFNIFLNFVAFKKMQEFDNSRNISFYNDGVRIGWKAGLLKACSKMIDLDQDFQVPFDISRDTSLYKDLLLKTKR